jgi:hypothetical protein
VATDRRSPGGCRRWKEIDMQIGILGSGDVAKDAVTGVLSQSGWDTTAIGNSDAARAVEPRCMPCCIAGFLRNERIHASRLLA